MGGMLQRVCYVVDDKDKSWSYTWTYPNGRMITEQILFEPKLTSEHVGEFKCVATSRTTSEWMERKFTFNPNGELFSQTIPTHHSSMVARFQAINLLIRQFINLQTFSTSLGSGERVGHLFVRMSA